MLQAQEAVGQIKVGVGELSRFFIVPFPVICFFSDAGLIDFLNSVLPHAGSVTRAHCGVLVERKTSFLS